jgi:hypothetical protein
MELQYSFKFKAWVEHNLGPDTNAAAVKRYFDRLGVKLTQEKWRMFLHQAPKRPDLIVWLDICDATGESLSTFIDYDPDGRPPGRLKERNRRAPKPAPCRAAAVVGEKAPPDPFAHVRGES